MPKSEVAISPQQEILQKVTSRLTKGEAVDFSDILKAVSPVAPVPEVPARLPLPMQITDEQRKAIARLPKVFGSVVPIERRALTPDEVEALIEERATLDAVSKLAKTRIESGIRVAVYNHFDVQAEEAEIPDGTVRDKDGHYILAGEERSPKMGKKFTREPRQGSPTLNEATLESLIESDEFPDFTRADYLAMTTQVRVIDENKVMIALKKNPALLQVIAKATDPGLPSASFYMRNA